MTSRGGAVVSRLVLLLATASVGLFGPGTAERAHAFQLSPTPPGFRLSMSLDLPAAPFGTLGYGFQSFRSLAASALDVWNREGIGIVPDHEFFSVAPAFVAGDASIGDRVNEVRFATTICGMTWGDTLGLTFIRSVGGKVVETDVLFNATVPWDAYPGPVFRMRDGERVREFFRVALHEFGHAAGLDHPDQAGQQVVAIMNSTIGDTDRLQTDDVIGAHAVAWGPPCAPAGAGHGSAARIAALVTGFYQIALGRNPSAAEISAWAEYLDANPHLGGVSVMVHAFFDGPEYRARPVTPWLQVWLLYASILGRAAEPAGQAAWVENLLDRFHPLLPLFVNSAEFRKLVPSSQDPTAVAAFVTRLYQRALGRTPGEAEVVAWTQYVLATGDMTGVARQFFDSPEYLVAARTLAEHVTRLYRALLAREPAPGEVPGPVSYLAGQLAEIEDGFVRSPEFLTRCQGLFR